MRDVALPLGDFLQAARYAYYVHGVSLLPDSDYDALEREWLDENQTLVFGESDHPLLKPGSDRREDYPDHIRALSVYYLTRHGKQQQCVGEDVKLW